MSRQNLMMKLNFYNQLISSFVRVALILFHENYQLKLNFAWIVNWFESTWTLTV